MCMFRHKRVATSYRPYSSFVYASLSRKHVTEGQKDRHSLIVTLNKKQLKVPVYSLLCLLTHGAGSPTIPNNPVLQSHFPLVSERSQKEKKNERGRQKRAERVRNRKGRRGYCVRGKKRRRNRETASSVGETETPAKLVGHAEHANDGIQLDRPIFTPLLCPSNNQQTQRDTRLKLTTHMEDAPVILILCKPHIMTSLTPSVHCFYSFSSWGRFLCWRTDILRV